MSQAAEHQIPPGFVIRDAVDEDRSQLIRLIAACWAEYPGCIMDVDGELPELLAIRLHYLRRGGRFWVVTKQGELVASIGVAPAPSPGTILLEKLYVAQAVRRRGIGTALVARADAEAWSRRAGAIEAWSDTRFKNAHRLYFRMGYRQLSETRELHDLSQSMEYHFQKRLVASNRLTRLAYA